MPIFYTSLSSGYIMRSRTLCVPQVQEYRTASYCAVSFGFGRREVDLSLFSAIALHRRREMGHAREIRVAAPSPAKNTRVQRQRRFVA